MNPFCSTPKAIEELKQGNMLIVIDSPDRENQGDLIFPAETVTADKVNFLLKACRGMICVAITKEHALRLQLPLMVSPIDNTERTNVQFTITVDAKNVDSFGISASDRAKTIKVLAHPASKPTDVVRPGHVFPLLARDGGIRERAGHTEAAVELSTLAGFSSCGMLCEILKDDGEVAQLPELIQFSQQYNIKIVSMKDIVTYIKENSLLKHSYKTIIKTASSYLPTEYGIFDLLVYKSVMDNREHILLRMGETLETNVLTRIHSQCTTGDTFHSLKCDCHGQLHKSLKMISKKKQGVLIYLNQEGRGIGLTNKIKAYALQEKGLDTVDANKALNLPIDARDYNIAAEMLRDLSISTINLLTNNPDKIADLTKYGITVAQQTSLEVPPNGINTDYLKTKKQKLSHLLTQV